MGGITKPNIKLSGLIAQKSGDKHYF